MNYVMTTALQPPTDLERWRYAGEVIPPPGTKPLAGVLDEHEDPATTDDRRAAIVALVERIGPVLRGTTIWLAAETADGLTLIRVPLRDFRDAPNITAAASGPVLVGGVACVPVPGATDGRVMAFRVTEAKVAEDVPVAATD
jgi:hypothetical protein